MRTGVSMKKYMVLLKGMLCFFLSTGAMAAEQNVTKIIICSLPGEGGEEVSFSIDNVTKEINYGFKKNGITELSVIFNKKNKLSRFTDIKMGVTYYGFKRGEYSYVIDIVDGSEMNEYTMSFDVKKNGKVIQSRGCLPSSLRSDNIKSEYIVDISYINENGFIFP